MALTKLSLKNFTVFDSIDLSFSKGINVFIGENATGKTHMMKVLYSACQAARVKSTAMDFPAKIVRVFRPDNLSLLRLAKRGMGGSNVSIVARSEESKLSLEFHSKYKNNVQITGMDKWEKEFSSLESTFIPAKEILSNSKNLVSAAKNLDFDDTYIDIIAAASFDLSKGSESERKKRYLKSLQEITKGRVKIEDEEFYLQPAGQSKLEFQLVAEGLRKIALLWQLIKNGTLERGSFLFWDEPEANLNPKHLPALVDMLLNLQQDGVQIFIATHDYVLAKYLEIKGNPNHEVQFHSFYTQENIVARESHDTFKGLRHNPIADAYNTLLDEVFEYQTKE